MWSYGWYIFGMFFSFRTHCVNLNYLGGIMYGDLSVIRGKIAYKKHYAEKCMNLPKYKEVPRENRNEWERKYNMLEEIKEQIEICEDLLTPLSEEMIEELCKMETTMQIYNYCRRVKFA